MDHIDKFFTIFFIYLKNFKNSLEKMNKRLLLNKNGIISTYTLKHQCLLNMGVKSTHIVIKG